MVDIAPLDTTATQAGEWNFQNQTAIPPPNGTVRFNQQQQNATTILNISASSKAGDATQILREQLIAGNFIRIVNGANLIEFKEFKITGDPTHYETNPPYFSAPVRLFEAGMDLTQTTQGVVIMVPIVDVKPPPMAIYGHTRDGLWVSIFVENICAIYQDEDLKANVLTSSGVYYTLNEGVEDVVKQFDPPLPFPYPPEKSDIDRLTGNFRLKKRRA